MTQSLLRFFIKDAQNTSDPIVRQKYGVLSGAVGLFCNIFLFAVKIIIGFLTGSISLTADAFNNLTDGFSNLVSIVGFKVSGKAPDESHPFGYGRTEYIAGFVVSFVIFFVGAEFFRTSVDRILHPAPVTFSIILLCILILSLAVKLWMGWFNIKVGNQISSPVLIAAGQDSRNDVLATSVVIIGLIAGKFTAFPIDGYIGILVSLFILWAGFSIAKDTLGPLLGQAADPNIAKKIKKSVLSSPEIVGVHDLIIHNYGVGKSLASVHAEVPSNSDFVAIHEIIDEAEKRVHEETGVYLVIHMDPIDVDDVRVSALRNVVTKILSEIDPTLSMHDFRLVDGERQINLIFDVVIPFSYNEENQNELLKTIRIKLQCVDFRYHPIITFDYPM